MKTIARTLIILFAAGLIALGWTAYANTDSAQSSMPERPAEFAPADGATADTGEAESHHHDGEEGFSVSRVLGGLALISGQTALVIALVALARLLGNWLVGYFNEARSHQRRLNAPPRAN
jgi:uncharacterized membrane protein YphA (DoxX/SURF4 family)